MSRASHSEEVHACTIDDLCSGDASQCLCATSVTFLFGLGDADSPVISVLSFSNFC